MLSQANSTTSESHPVWLNCQSTHKVILNWVLSQSRSMVT